LKSVPQLAEPHLQSVARSGDRTSREHAIRLLGRFGGASTVEFLTTLQTEEKSKPIQEAIAAALNDLRPASSTTADPSPTPPPRQPLQLNAPITPALRELIDKIVEKYNTFAIEHNERFKQAQLKNQHIYPHHELESLKPSAVDDFCHTLANGGGAQGS